MEHSVTRLVSLPKTVPLDASTLHGHAGSTTKHSSVEAITIPHFKFRNLDVLLESVEVIIRKGPLMESTMRKMTMTHSDVTGQTGKQPQEAFDGPSFSKVFSKFTWNENKYDLREPIIGIVHSILQRVEELEEAFQCKLAEYSEHAKKLDLERKKFTTNTAAIPMSYLIAEHARKGQLPMYTDFLVTLFIVVPAKHRKEWFSLYERLIDSHFVLPQSSYVIFEDDSNVIVSVMLFKKGVGDFRKSCIGHKWIVRDPSNEESCEDESLESLQNRDESARSELVRLLHTSICDYGEAYAHLRVIECFIESVLKYGLPADFSTFIVESSKEGYERLGMFILKTVRDSCSDIPVAYGTEPEDSFVSINAYCQ